MGEHLDRCVQRKREGQKEKSEHETEQTNIPMIFANAKTERKRETWMGQIKKKKRYFNSKKS